MAVIVHFTTLATFFWTNIMAWDIYKTFGQRTVLSHIRPTGRRCTDYNSPIYTMMYLHIHTPTSTFSLLEAPCST